MRQSRGELSAITVAFRGLCRTLSPAIAITGRLRELGLHMSISDAFEARHYEPGYVYIAGSLSGRVLKIGSCLRASKQGQYLRTKRYGGIDDWIVLYHVWVEHRGMIEHDARRDLPRVIRYYEKDGRMQRGREIVRCDFTVALNSLSKCLTDEQRAKAWRSPRSREFEFNFIEAEAERFKAEMELIRRAEAARPGQRLTSYCCAKGRI